MNAHHETKFYTTTHGTQLPDRKLAGKRFLRKLMATSLRTQRYFRSAETSDSRKKVCLRRLYGDRQSMNRTKLLSIRGCCKESEDDLCESLCELGFKRLALSADLKSVFDLPNCCRRYVFENSCFYFAID